ncbi:RNA polymerase sigma factor [Alkalibacillus sp. S2W]|uniref:RNA polymerase sigma factor n=1 Tax=Alkalibacillus sp. S2W TaxID=3386553 RepID=UPI00398CA0A9
MDDDLIINWFDQYADDIYRFLVFRLGTPDVEDLVQDVFIKAINHQQSFRGDANPKTWLISIARNLATDQMRKNKVRDWRRLIDEEDFQPKTVDSPETVVENAELKVYVRELINQLKPNYRDVVFLRGIEEFTVAETAQVLGWSENKVSTTYHRAIKALQRKGGVAFESES